MRVGWTVEVEELRFLGPRRERKSNLVKASPWTNTRSECVDGASKPFGGDRGTAKENLVRAAYVVGLCLHRWQGRVDHRRHHWKHGDPCSPTWRKTSAGSCGMRSDGVIPDISTSKLRRQASSARRLTITPFGGARRHGFRR